MGVTIGGEHLEHAAAELQDGDIERTATEVEDGNLHILVGLVDTVSQSGSRGLVHDTADVEACNLSGFLRSLTLRVREVGRYGDDGIRHFLSEVVLSGLLHLLQHHGRDFLRGVLTTVDVDTGIATLVYYIIRYARDFLFGLLPVLTHEALNRINGLLGVGDSLTLGGVADLALTVLYEANY